MLCADFRFSLFAEAVYPFLTGNPRTCILVFNHIKGSVDGCMRVKTCLRSP